MAIILRLRPAPLRYARLKSCEPQVSGSRSNGSLDGKNPVIGAFVKPNTKLVYFLSIIFVLSGSAASNAVACSTFMLNKGGELVFGHNLNENGIDVPGMVFINKRNVFKRGRTLCEIAFKNCSKPSSLSWISRYGSVTFNVFGRDFPDGGMNEAGLYIWEMNEEADYPQNEKLPKLMHMNWMQYALDNYSTIDEVIKSAEEIEIDGWTWHYFVADSRGRCASIAFIGKKVVVYQGESMPIPGLFNTPYDRELELLQYFDGFGGNYPVDLDNLNTPRFAKTAVMVRDFLPGQNAVDYGLMMLEKLKVQEIPKWSVLIDARYKKVFFKTRLNPEIKFFAISDFDFSNSSPVQVFNIDTANPGNVAQQFHAYDDNEMFELLMNLPFPDEFYQMGGLTREEFCNNATRHWHIAESSEQHHFAGRWLTIKNEADESSPDKQWTLNLDADGNAVSGDISKSGTKIKNIQIEHLRIVANKLVFTFRRAPDGEIFEVQGVFDGEQLSAQLFGIEDYYGILEFQRQ